MVFYDLYPNAKVHLLVVPRAHIANTDCLVPSDLDLGGCWSWLEAD